MLRLLRSRWARYAAGATLALFLIAYATRESWLASTGWLDRGRTTARASRGPADDVPDPDDPDDLLATRFDPFDPDEAPTLDAPGQTGETGPMRSPIATVGFEEEAPEPPPATNGKGSSREPDEEGSETLAGRPVEASKAAARIGKVEAGPVKSRPLADRKQIQELIDAGDYVEAQSELSQWYWQVPAEREKLLPDLNRISRALYFSPQPQYYDPYVVKPGDQLRVVGQRYKLSWEYLAKLNRIEPRKIRMGQKLKVVPGPFAAVVYLDRYELVVHLAGSYVKSYRVGLGKDGATPVGTFEVKNKIADPTYYGPDGVIAHDDPNNPLGERWVDIGDGFGIHGTIEPESIGKNESRGCIRMLNSDVEEVYDFLVIGSEVKIIRK